MTTAAEARKILNETGKIVKVDEGRGAQAPAGQTAAEPAAPALSEAMAKKVAFVRQHAEAHPEAGWDVVTETQTDEQLAQVIGRARSLTGAVNAVRESVVIPWVHQLAETRPGSDDDPQLAIVRALRAEVKANWYDATARLEGRANTIEPTRKLMATLPALPQVVEIDLTQVEEQPAPPKAAEVAAAHRPAARGARKTA